jgi:hypothetical protein
MFKLIIRAIALAHAAPMARVQSWSSTALSDVALTPQASTGVALNSAGRRAHRGLDPAGRRPRSVELRPGRHGHDPGHSRRTRQRVVPHHGASPRPRSEPLGPHWVRTASGTAGRPQAPTVTAGIQKSQVTVIPAPNLGKRNRQMAGSSPSPQHAAAGLRPLPTRHWLPRTSLAQAHHSGPLDQPCCARPAGGSLQVF